MINDTHGHLLGSRALVEAAAVIQYREKNGPFKSLADLKKVPGIDSAKIEAKKDSITF